LSAIGLAIACCCGLNAASLTPPNRAGSFFIMEETLAEYALPILDVLGLVAMNIDIS
jgi:hypothetical protein